MRKWRFTRPEKSGKSMVILAFLLTIFAHGLFLLPDYRMPPVDDNPGGTGIEMLNGANLAPEQKTNFKNWLALHDPAAVSRSDSPAGYTAFLQPRKWLSVDTVAYRSKEIIHDMTIPGFSPLTLKKRNSSPMPEFAETVPQISVQKQIIILDSKGRRRNELLKTIPSYSGTVSPTVVQAVRFGKLCTFSVISSSGNRSLDQAVISAAAEMNVPSRETVTVIWPQGGSK